MVDTTTKMTKIDMTINKDGKEIQKIMLLEKSGKNKRKNKLSKIFPTIVERKVHKFVLLITYKYKNSKKSKKDSEIIINENHYDSNKEKNDNVNLEKNDIFNIKYNNFSIIYS